MNVSILTTDGDYVTLCEVKSYLKVNGTDRDGFIVDCIKSAVSFVEKKIDRSLLTHTVRYITNNDYTFMLPLSDIVSVESVTDYLSGNDVDYTLSADKRVLTIANTMQVDISYTTQPIVSNEAKVAVLALISLLYDGITDVEKWNTVLFRYLQNYMPL